MSEATNEIYFNQWDPEFRANPYPHYKAMLQGPPRIINITIPATPDLLKMFGIEDPAIKEIPLPTALAFLAWFVFAPQCLSTVAVTRRETNGWKWPAFMLGYLFVLAYAAAGATYWGAIALGL